MRLGKAQRHWEFHACLSRSQPCAPCKATGRTASRGCQLPGPLGCLPQKAQPGALWEASDIFHRIAAQVEPHTVSPGPAVSPGPSGSSFRGRGGSRWGPLLTSTGFPSTAESATQPKDTALQFQTYVSRSRMLGGGMSGNEAECSEMNGCSSRLRDAPCGFPGK